MKTNIILSGVVAAVALGAMDASAQFNYHNGDLLAAFGNGGSTDVIVDLGAISNFQPANWVANSWNLNSVLTATFGSVSSSVYWSVFGVNDTSSGGNPAVTQGDPNTIWSTLARSNPTHKTTTPLILGNSTAFQLPLGDIQSIANLTSPGLAAPGLIVNDGVGIELVSTSLGGYSTMMTGAYNGNLQGDWSYNMLNNGVGVSDLYQSDPNNTRATYLGNFSLDSTGMLAFTPTPEPSTWAMLGSGALALLAIRRRK